MVPCVLREGRVGTYRGLGPRVAILAASAGEDSHIVPILQAQVPHVRGCWSLPYISILFHTFPCWRHPQPCVQALNVAGEGPFCEPLSVTTMPSPPGPPEGARVVSTGVAPEATAWVEVAWQLPSPSPACAAAAGYEVIALAAAPPSAPNDLGATTTSAVAPLLQGLPAARMTPGKGVTECRLTGLVPGSSYVVRLRSVGAEGAGHSSWGEDVPVITAGRRPVLAVTAAAGAAPASSGKAGKKGGKKGGGGCLAASAQPLSSTTVSDDGSGGGSRSGGACVQSGGGAVAHVMSTAAAKAATARRAGATGSAKKVLAAAATAAASRPAKHRSPLNIWFRRVSRVVLSYLWSVLLVAFLVMLFVLFRQQPK